MSAAYLILRDNAKAIEAAENGLAALPGNVELIHARVRALKGRVASFIEQENIEDALTTADEALKAAEGSQRGSLLFLRGLSLNLLQRYQEALECFTEAERSEAPQRGSFAFCLQRATAFNETGHFAEALATIEGFDASDATEDSRSQLAFLRGIALNGLERHAEACRTLSEVRLSALSHLRASLAFQRAVAMTALKRYEDALAETDSGLSGSPEPAVLFLLFLFRGSCLNALGRPRRHLTA